MKILKRCSSVREKMPRRKSQNDFLDRPILIALNEISDNPDSREKILFGDGGKKDPCD